MCHISQRTLALFIVFAQSLCVSEEISACPSKWIPLPRTRRIFYGLTVGPYDIDALEIMLYELGDLVHTFIITEGDHDFQGKRKGYVLPALLEGNWAMFRNRIQLNLVKLESTVCQKNAWDCEHQQFNAILRGAKEDGLVANDVLVVGHADEILNRRAISLFRHCAREHESRQALRPALVNHYYSISWRDGYFEALLVAPGTFWLREDIPSPSKLRMNSHKPLIGYGCSRNVTASWCNTNEWTTNWRMRWTAGWHISNFGGASAVQTKLKSVSHGEYNRPPFNTLEFIAKTIETGTRIDRPLTKVDLSKAEIPRAIHLRSDAHCWIDGSSCP